MTNLAAMEKLLYGKKLVKSSIESYGKLKDTSKTLIILDLLKTTEKCTTDHPCMMFYPLRKFKTFLIK